ncbi:YjfB family protein [Massilia scottii]|uniref:YjfB family protein n=1 Tax=Massilia scottii TaxID=3057166 RepID=UPI002796D084|nr:MULTISPECIES: YjfB family protein [unclassified Massilia]MDQ1817576.1 YjfB family protein [Massilia sp. CCM 9210]MDQ1835320.1 YjfB family protein [Massilia sp. CCM 9029]
MDVSGIASLATSMAQTGIKQEVGYAVLKKAQQMEGQVAAQLIDALPQSPRLPSNLGNTINTTA